MPRMLWSLPSLGAWIETIYPLDDGRLEMSLPSLGAWIETCFHVESFGVQGSLPSLGAWIETIIGKGDKKATIVAPFIGSVD